MLDAILERVRLLTNFETSRGELMYLVELGRQRKIQIEGVAFTQPVAQVQLRGPSCLKTPGVCETELVYPVPCCQGQILDCKTLCGHRNSHNHLFRRTS